MLKSKSRKYIIYCIHFPTLLKFLKITIGIFFLTTVCRPTLDKGEVQIVAFPFDRWVNLIQNSIL